MVMAVILAAGRTATKYGFPAGSKPKCLFHIEGKTILESMVNSLREAGIKEIRVVVGYKGEMIEKHIVENNLDLDIVYDREWSRNSLSSINVGTADVDDDVLLLLGDHYMINCNAIKRFLEHKSPIVCIKPMEHWKIVDGVKVHRIESLVCIVRINREMLNIIDEKAIPKIIPYNPATTGVALVHGLYNSIKNSPLLGEVVIEKPLKDFDRYHQSDEGKK